MSIAGGVLAASLAFLPGITPESSSAISGQRAYARIPPQVRSLIPGRAPLPTLSVPADTLRHTVRGGEVLIFALPAALDQQRVERYRIIQAPALSWLEDRSVLWRTRREDAGEHLLLFQAFIDEQQPDTVRVLVVVE